VSSAKKKMRQAHKTVATNHRRNKIRRISSPMLQTLGNLWGRAKLI
jgi:hypothetical protein